MGWKRDGERRWKGTGVVDGFRIEFLKRASRMERSVYSVLHGKRYLGVSKTRSGANHCADEHSRMLLFQQLGINDPNSRPTLVGDAIWFQGRVLYPDEQAGMNWVFEEERVDRHRRITYLDWEDAWHELTGSYPQSK